jgi:hypothetical protein
MSARYAKAFIELARTRFYACTMPRSSTSFQNAMVQSSLRLWKCNVRPNIDICINRHSIHNVTIRVDSTGGAVSTAGVVALETGSSRVGVLFWFSFLAPDRGGVKGAAAAGRFVPKKVPHMVDGFVR